MNRLCIKCTRIKPAENFTPESRKAICLECWPKCTRRRTYPGYKITYEMFAKLMKVQNGVCAICGADKPHCRAEPGDALHIDHDHETGQVRGLLCVSCNVSLERRQHRADLPAYSAYLKDTPAQRAKLYKPYKNCTGSRTKGRQK